MRKRQSFINLCSPSVSTEEKVEILYEPIVFGEVFSRSAVDQIRQQLDSKEARQAVQRLPSLSRRGGSAGVVGRAPSAPLFFPRSASASRSYTPQPPRGASGRPGQRRGRGRGGRAN